MIPDTPEPFRPARRDDLDNILAMLRRAVEAIPDTWYTPCQRAAWAALFTPEALGELLEGEAHTLVCEDPGRPGRVLGFASLTGDELKMLYVDPAAQGSGLGHRLFQAMEAEARRRGLVRLRLRASANARGFYERQGVTPDRTVWSGAASCDCGGHVLCTWMVKELG
ncbi:N-acetyltransferase family protein [Megalodesulfovibrio paquesii]